MSASVSTSTFSTVGMWSLSLELYDCSSCRSEVVDALAPEEWLQHHPAALRASSLQTCHHNTYCCPCLQVAIVVSHRQGCSPRYPHWRCSFSCRSLLCHLRQHTVAVLEDLPLCLPARLLRSCRTYSRSVVKIEIFASSATLSSLSSMVYSGCTMFPVRGKCRCARTIFHRPCVTSSVGMGPTSRQGIHVAPVLVTPANRHQRQSQQLPSPPASISTVTRRYFTLVHLVYTSASLCRDTISPQSDIARASNARPPSPLPFKQRNPASAMSQAASRLSAVQPPCEVHACQRRPASLCLQLRCCYQVYACKGD